MLKLALHPGWVLSILLEASDFTRHPSKTVRLHLFSILRDAWQLRPSLQVRAILLFPVSLDNTGHNSCLHHDVLASIDNPPCYSVCEGFYQSGKTL